MHTESRGVLIRHEANVENRRCELDMPEMAGTLKEIRISSGAKYTIDFSPQTYFHRKSRTSELLDDFSISCSAGYTMGFADY